ncbi:hypothetical protein PAXRUDRAFT_831104 [Paxillus rubicundulus Ve08.2h10]|uniref:Uncharacterized protein n=1 Tax=Paxillus rubicundulus Ve08.2h10 TaxID=930991 RepID=A0A0D0DSI6_9AGAM|nr:hypothetical protein PAXRUDRAFT_831104 [Paxillus rubicundulus Ve08.2h10]
MKFNPHTQQEPENSTRRVKKTSRPLSSPSCARSTSSLGSWTSKQSTHRIGM